MSYCAKEASKQLGMNESKASARLKKRIMFDLVKKTKQDICFKCGKSIETAEELSIEHKIEWLHRSPVLFWDLNNIAFSHIKCNRPRSMKGRITKRRIQPPDGKSWCKNCGWMDVEQFHKKHNRHNGLHHLCVLCTSKSGKANYKLNKVRMNSRSREYYINNKERIIKQTIKRQQNDERKAYMREYYLKKIKPIKMALKEEQNGNTNQ